MNYRSRFRCLAGLAALAALTCGGFVTTCAQENTDSSEQLRSSLTLPASQDMLRLDVDVPRNVRVSDQFEFHIRVTNLTDNVVLRHVRIGQQTAKSLDIESAQLQPAETKRNEKKANGQERQQEKQQKPDQEQPDEQESDQASTGQKSQKQSQAQQGPQEWTIAELNPGETRTIRVQATSDEEGRKEICLMVRSFTPALCLVTEFTKPELEVALQVPKDANVCEPFEIEYFVKNAGSGPVKTLKIEGELPQGLKLDDGREKVNFEIDGLNPDEVRKFVATVVASDPGSYTTRAKASAGDLQARSKKHEINVRAANLAVAVDGPQEVYIERQAEYTIRVTNHGDAAARDASLVLRYPADVGLHSTGEVMKSEKKVSADRAKTENQETQTSEKQDRQDQPDNQPEWAAEEWELGDLEPGQTRLVKVTLRPDEAKAMKLEAVAVHLCGSEEKREEVEARATASTKVISVPALAIAVIDEADPVRVDEQVTYRIVLTNEGTAAAEQLDVNVKLPEQLKFVEGNGKTDINAKEGSLNISTLEKLEPGEKATWEVTVRAEQSGSIRFPVEVTTNQSEQPIRAEEPTRLIKR